MKLSNVFAKLPFGTTKVLSMLGGLVIAGAALTAAAPAAQAQWGVGVQFGGPRYAERVPAPVYRGYGGYYAGRGYNGYVIEPGRYGYDRRREAWREHEYFEQRRAREFYGRPVPYRGW